jgi:ABC-type phosphate/phosphonate transport system substrate-binding protein
MSKRSYARLFAIFALLSFACGRQGRDGKAAPEAGETPPLTAVAREPVYSFGVPPMRPVRSMWRLHAPWVSSIGRATGLNLRLESAQTFPSYVAKLRGGALDFALADPYQILAAEDWGYTAIAKAGSRSRIASCVLVKRGAFRRPRDLRGKVVALPSGAEFASVLLSRCLLSQIGLDLERNAHPLYTPSAASAISNLAVGRADAAAVAKSEWQHYQADRHDAAAELIVLAQSDDISGPGIIAARTTPKDVAAAVRAALISARADHDGVFDFVRADSVSYDDAWEVVNEYSRRFGPVLAVRK